jgi:hypothetical protein
MAIAYSLTPELRRKLKKPIGTLICGSFRETIERLGVMVKAEKPPCLISVGDTVSTNLAKSQLPPQLMIVDNICMRRKVKEPVQLATDKIVNVRNPQATITAEAATAIRDSLKSATRVKIVVDGEEDLLTLIAVLYAPIGSFVVYGQPCEGIVVVKATPEKKAEVTAILAEMDVSSKS